MEKRIKVALVGLGRIGWANTAGEMEKKSDKFEVVAACDLESERIEKMAERFGCKTYTDYEEMLKQEDIELVIISTRSVDHYAHGMKALAAGKHVMLEKPVTCSYAEAVDLYAHANKIGTPRLFVHQQRRFEGPFQKVKEIIDSGKLGKVFEVSIDQKDYQRRNDWQTLQVYGGGQLLNWGPHIIDQSWQLLGTPTAEVQSYVHQVAAGGNCEDHLRIRFIGDNDRVVNMSISGGTALRTGRTYEVYGDKGALVCVNGKIHMRYINPEQKLGEVISQHETPSLASFGTTGTFAMEEEIDWIEEDLDVANDNFFIGFWDYLYDSLLNGTPFPIKDHDVLKIMETISLVKAQNKKILKAE